MDIDSEATHARGLVLFPPRSSWIAFIVPALMLLGLLIGCSGSLSAPGYISGTVSVPGSQTGTIYVLAIPEANKAKLRVVETEARPTQSAWVAASVRLSEPGNYTLALAPGSYAVWAWVDVNGDGGVNHADYAEPTGWHQTAANLHLPPVTVAEGKTTSGIDLTLTSPTPYPTADRTVANGTGGGKLTTIRGQKVLQLWGTPAERAYCHGYLVGPQIVDFINYVDLAYFAQSVSRYEEVLQYLQTHAAGNAPYAGEADAMLQGMQDGGANITVAALGRPLTRDDLILHNNIAILRFWVLHGSPFWPLAAAPSRTKSRFLLASLSPEKGKGLNYRTCTSAVFWGDWTQNSELNGALIHGKNNDGENDLHKMTVNSALIIATTPPAASGKKKTVGIDWPGYYGTYHGMNEDGLVIQAQSSLSISNWDAANILDYSLYYREALQAASTVAGAVALWGALPATRAVGFNTPVSTPYLAGQPSAPSSTYEADSYGWALRAPVDFAPGDAYSILTTNNYYKYQGTPPNERAVGNVHGYHATVEPADYRFRDMLNLVAQYRDQGRTVGTPEVIELLRAASTSKEYSGTTEFSLLWYPNSREFALAKEDLVQKVLDAPFTTYRRFTFAEVFP
ncbi:MAG: hypothetical protein M0009_15875 [Deltaproteobacteria bacterium]|nr:hypothetical protein [Deltaproteobacteria bacterium]